MVCLNWFQEADRKIISWPLQATEAIQYIYSKEVVHYNVGIHNFLVQENDTFALVDFGGSCVNGNKSLEAGLLYYKQLTLARDSDPTEMDDLFSLGMVIYKIKMEQIVYTGKSNSKICKFLESWYFPDLAPLSLEWHIIVNKC